DLRAVAVRRQTVEEERDAWLCKSRRGTAVGFQHLITKPVKTEPPSLAVQVRAIVGVNNDVHATAHKQTIVLLVGELLSTFVEELNSILLDGGRDVVGEPNRRQRQRIDLAASWVNDEVHVIHAIDRAQRVAGLETRA